MVHSFNQKLIIMLKEKKINAGEWSEVVVQALLNLGYKWQYGGIKTGKYVYLNSIGNIYSDSQEFEKCSFNEMSVAGVLRYASTELISRKIVDRNPALKGRRPHANKFNSVPEELLGRDFDEKNHAADAFGFVISTGGRRIGRTFGLEELLNHNPRGSHWLHKIVGTLDTPRKATDFYYEGKPVKPFDRVLFRDGEDHNWRAGLFSHINKGEIFPYVVSAGAYKECIPYAGNENLLGTTKNP